MNCPVCGATMENVTDSWHTFAEAEGAEYLASYVTIWHCAGCGTVVGAGDEVEWVMEREEAAAEETAS